MSCPAPGREFSDCSAWQIRLESVELVQGNAVYYVGPRVAGRCVSARHPIPEAAAICCHAGLLLGQSDDRLRDAD